MDSFMWMVFVLPVFHVNKGASLSQLCNFGPGCPFPCNCANDLACDPVTGSCSPGECRVASPGGYQWTGHGCLTGNIAHGGEARQNGQFEDYEASLALDGNWTVPENVSESVTCAQPDAPLPQGHTCASDEACPNAWWQVDLGALYYIRGVDIRGSMTPSGRQRTNNVDIRVKNSSEVGGFHYQLCTWFKFPSSHFKSNCYPPVIGRYVTVFKHNRTKELDDILGRFTLCEVVIRGNLYNNCTDCDGVCTGQYGCVKCPPGLKPSSVCNEECSLGYYGENCQERCGMCRSLGVRTCDKRDGRCFEECDIWWSTDKCDMEIVSVGFKPNDIHVISRGMSNITIRWYAIESIPNNLSAQYGYEVFQRNTSKIWLQYDVAKHVQGKAYTVKLENLKSNSSYDIKIVPFRTDRGHKDIGTPVTLNDVRTLCGDPCRKPYVQTWTVPSHTQNPTATAASRLVSQCSAGFWGLYASAIVALIISITINILLCLRIRQKRTPRRLPEPTRVVDRTGNNVVTRTGNNVGGAGPATRRPRAEPNDYIITTGRVGGGLNIGESETSFIDDGNTTETQNTSEEQFLGEL